MKLLKIGKTKVKCQRKDGKEKWYSSSSKVISFAKNVFKTGDEVKATFDDNTREIIKLTKVGGYQKKDYSKGGSYNNNGQYDNMTERSVFASVANIVANLKGITMDNVKTTVEDLFETGMKLIKGKKVKSKNEEELDEENEEDDDDEEEEEEEEE